MAGEYKDADPVGARLSLLMIGDISSWRELRVRCSTQSVRDSKRESPYRSMMVTVANGGGNTGYIPNDAAFGTRPLKSSPPGSSRVCRVRHCQRLIEMMPKALGSRSEWSRISTVHFCSSKLDTGDTAPALFINKESCYANRAVP